MKTLKQTFLVLAMLVIATFTMAQMAVVEYMKVKPGDGNKYLSMEKAWKKIHDARMKAGLIESWSLYENMFAGANEPYQYAVVTVYKDMAAYEAEGYEAAGRAAYPNYNDKDWDDFYIKTNDSRVMSTIDVYTLVTAADAKASKPEKYFALSMMNVKPGGEGAYEKIEKDYYKPMHEDMIKTGKMEGWSIWAKHPGNYRNDQYIAVNSYSTVAQITSGSYFETLKKLMPNMKMDDLAAKTTAARTITEEFTWKMIDDVSKN